MRCDVTAHFGDILFMFLSQMIENAQHSFQSIKIKYSGLNKGIVMYSSIVVSNQYFDSIAYDLSFKLNTFNLH
jgi:hypothetical protein